MNLRKRILVAPLNWGLGHATRCIPIINALISSEFEPIIASDGSALSLLKKEFPKLPWIELPSYNISYSKKANGLKLHLLRNTPSFLKAIKSEKKQITKFVEQNNIDGIISDNRFGVHHEDVPSVFITHQLNVLSGSSTWFSTRIHQKFIKQFDECWVPDFQGKNNLSGVLGHPKTQINMVKYIGPISRFEYKKSEKKYDIMVLLSGPEPQRSVLENILLEQLINDKRTILFVRGVVEFEQSVELKNNVTIYNYMSSQLLEKAINESEIIISRSGYTTIMDLAKLGKKAFFIPTPGQYEQEYLAKRLDKLKLVPYCKQDAFNIEKLEQGNFYKGLDKVNNSVDFDKLFSLFKSKRELASYS